MEQVKNNRLSVSIDELRFNDENCSHRGRLRKIHYDDDGTKVFTSKNLETERKRREKLSTRLLLLRSLVPNISSMNKASIIEDAITYTKKLQNEVERLTKDLQGMEATTEKRKEPKTSERSALEDMKKWGIQEEIQVAKIDGNKLWVKFVIGNKRGSFKKLMETMHDLYIDIVDISVTTIKGAYLITASLQGRGGEPIEVHQIPNIIKFNII